jgi:exosortase
MMEAKRISFGWKSWQTIKASFILLLTAAFLGPALLELLENWSSNEDYSHGFLVLPIFVYLAWKKKNELLEIDADPQWIGFPLLLASATLYYIGMSVKFHTLAFISMLAVLFSLLIFLTGWRATRLLLLPLCFLVFMFPIPNAYYVSITNPLRLFITKISSTIIYGLGIPVYRDGNILILANAKLEVADACSGIRSLYSYLMVGCVFAILSKSNVTRVSVIASSFILSLTVNLVRVTVTAILAHFYGQSACEGIFHSSAGIFVFVIGFCAMFVEWIMLEKRFKGPAISSKGTLY